MQSSALDLRLRSELSSGIFGSLELIQFGAASNSLPYAIFWEGAMRVFGIQGIYTEYVKFLFKY